MTPEDVMGLMGLELAAAVGREVMGYLVYLTTHDWHLDGTKTKGHNGNNAHVFVLDQFNCDRFPAFSVDANAVRDMEAEIERRGLIRGYIAGLDRLMSAHQSYPPYVGGGGAYTYWEGPINALFALLHAPLETKCRAALLAVLSAEAGAKEGGRA